MGEANTRIYKKGMHETLTLICKMTTVVNTTITFSLNTELDLLFLARNLWDVEYKPKRFPSLVMRMRDPRVTALISRSGKVVLVGGKSLKEGKIAAKKVCRRVGRHYESVMVKNLRVMNMVGSGVHDFDLTDYWNQSSKTVMHEPELFAGLLVDLHCGLKATLFRTGKYFITGAKSESDLEAADLELMLKFYF
jgi:transcription initiation factor TFIID TATA-box-binding protein